MVDGEGCDVGCKKTLFFSTGKIKRGELRLVSLNDYKKEHTDTTDGCFVAVGVGAGQGADAKL